ncbi:MAG TPA: sodium:solute symporter [Bryobacteraceae bacterium]|nr:sodium:solute symporter [Bryobacteraceae bacterium]
MRWLDLAVILAYLAGITWFGARFRKSQHSLRDYFLGGRSIPWWAIALSIVSAETSTLTVIGTPVLAFQGDFGFLQLVLGYLLARVVIATLFLPAYFRGEMYTAYELIRGRFGERLRRLTAAAFLILRALAEGVRVFAISIVVSVVLGSGETASILVILCLTLFYTYEGGLSAVIWTDVVQMFLYVFGAALSLFLVLRDIPGGWTHVTAVAAPLGKLRVFDFRLAPPAIFFARTYSFWAGIVGGCFLTTASHGTEQLMVQRLLAARNRTQSQVALLTSWIVIFFQFTLFLAIGVCLFVFYRERGLPPPAVSDRLYPLYIWRNLPPGAAGLVMAAILAASMSNLSAALNSLASTTVLDLIRPLWGHRRTDVSDAVWLRMSRLATIAWGAVLAGIALLARNWGSVLQAGLSIASIVYGSLLGVFLLGLLTKRVREMDAVVGMATGLAAMLYVRLATSIAFTWYVVIGSAATFFVGLAISAFREDAA